MLFYDIINHLNYGIKTMSFSPIMSLLILSLMIMPTLLSGKVNEGFAKVTIGFVISLFSSTVFLFIISIILLVVNFFI